MTLHCLDCGKRISRNHQRCKPCSARGILNPRYGQPVSAETRAKIGAASANRAWMLDGRKIAPEKRSVCIHGHEDWMYKRPQWNARSQRYYWGWRCRECERLSNLDRSRRRRARLKAAA